MNFIKYKLPAVVWGVIILALTSYPTLSLPDLGFNLSDKAAHFGVYFILAIMIFWAIVQGNLEISSKQFWKTFLYSALFGFFDELHQIPIPGRSGEIYDFLADVLGTLTAALLFLWLYPTFIKLCKKGNSYAN